MICGRVDAWPSLCWTWSMLFLCRGGYSLLIAVVHVISSTSGSYEWWFALLRMVVDGEVASWRLVWRHAADEHGAVRCVWWPPLMVVGLRACGLKTGLAVVPAGGAAGCNHATIDGLGAIWLPSVGSVLMVSVLAMEMKSPWSRREDPCQRRPLWLHAGAATQWMWSADLQWTDVACSLCTALHSQGPPRRPRPRRFVARRHRHSKVLVMLEDEQRSLGVLETVAAILYLPDADVVWFCFVPNH
jgi:hypothetical protein